MSDQQFIPDAMGRRKLAKYEKRMQRAAEADAEQTATLEWKRERRHERRLFKLKTEGLRIIEQLKDSQEAFNKAKRLRRKKRPCNKKKTIRDNAADQPVATPLDVASRSSDAICVSIILFAHHGTHVVIEKYHCHSNRNKVVSFISTALLLL